MEAKKIHSKDFCAMESVKFIAFRYGTSPEQVLRQYLVQTGIIRCSGPPGSPFEPELNEIALPGDAGVHPARVEIF